MVSTDEQRTAQVAAALSPERLEPYLTATNGDQPAALRLCEWNLAVSGAFYEALEVVEVVLRNALNIQLIARHGGLAGEWYDDPGQVLSGVARQHVEAARRRVRKLRRSETPGWVVAELSFGFLEVPACQALRSDPLGRHLRHAFPNLQPQSRMTVYPAVDDLHMLRNRAAHHEPIHARDLKADALTIPSTSSVSAIANTPSENASIRPVFTKGLHGV